MNTFLDNLRIRATEGYISKIILPEAEDERVLEAGKILVKEKIATPVFVAIKEEQANDLEKLLLELRSSKIGTKDELTNEVAHRLARDPLMYGMYMLRLGEADGLVAGAVYTSADVIR